jgi:hypothetical protein
MYFCECKSSTTVILTCLPRALVQKRCWRSSHTSSAASPCWEIMKMRTVMMDDGLDNSQQLIVNCFIEAIVRWIIGVELRSFVPLQYPLREGNKRRRTSSASSWLCAAYNSPAIRRNTMKSITTRAATLLLLRHHSCNVYNHHRLVNRELGRK